MQVAAMILQFEDKQSELLMVLLVFAVEFSWRNTESLLSIVPKFVQPLGCPLESC